VAKVIGHFAKKQIFIPHKNINQEYMPVIYILALNVKFWYLPVPVLGFRSTPAWCALAGYR
jgi:hypothetical protein